MVRSLIIPLLFVLFGLTAGCSGTAEYAVVGTPRSPGSDGTIQVEEIEGGNQLVTIFVEHLVPPARLGDNLTAYMVWFQGPGQQPVKAGNLAYDDDDRTGRLTATTPLAEFQLKITAERNAEVAAPSEIVITSLHVGE